MFRHLSRPRELVIEMTNWWWLAAIALPLITAVALAFLVRRKPHWKRPLLWATAGIVLFKLFEMLGELVVRSAF